MSTDDYTNQALRRGIASPVLKAMLRDDPAGVRYYLDKTCGARKGSPDLEVIMGLRDPVTDADLSVYGNTDVAGPVRTGSLADGET